MILKHIKISLKKVVLLIRISYFNWKNKTNISSIRASLKARYGINVSIGENTLVSDNVYIGDYSYINSNSHIENCHIGKFCSISSGVYICPAEHDYKLLTTHPISGKTKDTICVVIGNDVLISLNAIILQGVKIGDGAIIAAGAIVTKDVSPYEIVGGNPAKHIKFRFESEVITSLQSSEWWNWEVNQIKDAINKMDY